MFNNLPALKSVDFFNYGVNKHANYSVINEVYNNVFKHKIRFYFPNFLSCFRSIDYWATGVIYDNGSCTTCSRRCDTCLEYNKCNGCREGYAPKPGSEHECIKVWLILTYFNKMIV